MAGSFSLGILLLAGSVLHASCRGLAHPASRRNDDPHPLQAVVDQLANDLVAVKAQLTAQRNELEAQVTAKENELNAKIAAQQTQLQGQASEIAALKAVNARVVAFSAYITDEPNVKASHGSTIPFKGVISNVGGGYNAASSAFTAPVAGQFFFIVHVDCSTDFRFLSVARNGHSVFQAHNDFQDGHVTGSGVLTLAQGDVVTIRFINDAGYVDAGVESTFSGFLVK